MPKVNRSYNGKKIYPNLINNSKSILSKVNQKHLKIVNVFSNNNLEKSYQYKITLIDSQKKIMSLIFYLFVFSKYDITYN